MKNTYTLLDSGHGEKWERFGEVSLIRPCPQAVWSSQLSQWSGDARFSRDTNPHWQFQKKIPASWTLQICGVHMKIAPTEFGHLGVFPEHASLAQEMQSLLKPKDKILNLFAYSGLATLVAAQTGALVCHVDSSKGMVDWARENAKINSLESAPIRWIVDDVMKFLKREVKRQSFYEGVLLDPPTFGRGSQGEVFKIEEELIPLLTFCKEILSSHPRFVFFSCHTPGMTPLVIEHVLQQVFKQKPHTGEMVLESFLESSGALAIPSGSFGKVVYD